VSVKHTPGPWEAIKGAEKGDEHRCAVAAVRGDMRYLVAFIENGAPGDWCETELANAHLIAAAPDTLGALKYARNLIGPDEVIDAAIARATGEPS